MDQYIKQKKEELREASSNILNNIKMLEEEELKELQPIILKEIQRREEGNKKKCASIKELVEVYQNQGKVSYCYYKDDMNNQGEVCVSDITKELADKLDIMTGIFEYKGRFFKFSSVTDYLRTKDEKNAAIFDENGRVVIRQMEFRIRSIDVRKLSDEN